MYLKANTSFAWVAINRETKSHEVPGPNTFLALASVLDNAKAFFLPKIKFALEIKKLEMSNDHGMACFCTGS